MDNGNIGTEPNYHLDECDLLAYATGTCSESYGLLVATHINLCAACGDRLRILEAVGGALIEWINDDVMSSTHEASSVVRAMLRALDGIDNNLDGNIGESSRRPAPIIEDSVTGTAAAIDASKTPAALIDYADKVETRRIVSRVVGIEAWPLHGHVDGTHASLIRVGAGRTIPRHGHGGRESTLVLAGNLRDRDEVYRRGDVATADADVVHMPRAGSEQACVCMVVSESAVRLKNPLMRHAFAARL